MALTFSLQAEIDIPYFNPEIGRLEVTPAKMLFSITTKNSVFSYTPKIAKKGALMEEEKKDKVDEAKDSADERGSQKPWMSAK